MISVLSKLGGVAKSTLHTIALRIIGAGLVFVLQVLLARTLGVDEYGVYAFVISVVSIVAMFATLGFETSLNRFVPEYSRKEAWSELRGLIIFAFRVCFAVGVGSSLLILILGAVIGDYDSRDSMMWGILMIVFLSLTNIRIALLRSFKKFVQAVFPETVLRPLLLVILVTIFWSLELGLNSEQAIILQLLATMFSFLIGGFFLKKVTACYSAAVPRYKPKFWLLSSLPMLLTSGSTFLISQTDIVMLGALKEFNFSGIYNAVSRMAALAIFFMTAINFVIAPLISDAFADENKAKLNNLVVKSARFSFGLAIFVLVVFYFFGRDFLGIFGETFEAGYFALMILLVGHSLNTSSGPVGLLLSLTGSQLFVAKVLACCAIANIFLNYFLINTIGLEGAALSTMLTTVTWNLLMHFRIRKLLGINSSIFGSILIEKS